jgi:hypothetical protein
MQALPSCNPHNRGTIRNPPRTQPPYVVRLCPSIDQPLLRLAAGIPAPYHGIQAEMTTLPHLASPTPLRFDSSIVLTDTHLSKTITGKPCGSRQSESIQE